MSVLFKLNQLITVMLLVSIGASVQASVDPTVDGKILLGEYTQAYDMTFVVDNNMTGMDGDDMSGMGGMGMGMGMGDTSEPVPEADQIVLSGSKMFLTQHNRDLVVGVIITPNYVDNTVNTVNNLTSGQNIIEQGWDRGSNVGEGKHTFDNLLGSDNAVFEITMLNGDTVAFGLDYIAEFTTLDNGLGETFYQSAGIVPTGHNDLSSTYKSGFLEDKSDAVRDTGAYGEEIYALAEIVTEAETSMGWNLNNTSILPASKPGVVSGDMTSPELQLNGDGSTMVYENLGNAADPENGNYVPVDSALDQWEYRWVYEFRLADFFPESYDFDAATTLDLDTTLGIVDVLSTHASPSKTGGTLTDPVPIPPGIPPPVVIPTPTASLAGVALFSLLAMRRKRHH